MGLLEDFRKLRSERQERLDALTTRADESAAQIARLMAQIQADNEACEDLRADIAILDEDIARWGEHEPAAEPDKPTASDSLREAEEIVADRRAAAEGDAKRPRTASGRRAHPDPVKAAKKAAREAAEPVAPASVPGASRCSVDPLHVHRRSVPTGKKLVDGIKRPRIYELSPPDVDMRQFTTTDLTRADLVYDLLIDADGRATQSALIDAYSDFMDLTDREGTAGSHVSRSLKALVGQNRVVWTGEKLLDDNGRIADVVWVVRAADREAMTV